MTVHIFWVYLFFIAVGFFFLMLSRIILPQMFSHHEPGLGKRIATVGFFLLIGFPGVISIIRKEFPRPVGKANSGWFSVLGGIMYLLVTSGALVIILLR